jgi:hypothetical protein
MSSGCVFNALQRCTTVYNDEAATVTATANFTANRRKLAILEKKGTFSMMDTNHECFHYSDMQQKLQNLGVKRLFNSTILSDSLCLTARLRIRM